MIDYDTLYNSIIRGTCIVIIGPELVVENGQSPGFFELFMKHLQDKGRDTQDLISEDGFFPFENKEEMLTAIVNFNESCSKERSSLYKKIAEIPFRLIFQVSTDIKLHKTYKDLGLKHRFLCYNAQEPTKDWGLDYLDEEDPTILISLLLDYNSEKECVNNAVLSYEDFISFIGKFYGNNPLPVGILTAIKKATHIIFLGYRFDKWYWKLIFDLFNFPDPDIRIAGKTNIAILNNETNGLFASKTFYERQYKTTFENQSIEKFISELHERFRLSDKLLKTAEQNDASFTAKSLAQKVITQCKNSELAKAIETMNDFEKLIGFDVEYQNTIYEIIASFTDKIKSYVGRERPINEEFDTSRIPSKDAKLIRGRIFELMTEIKKQ